MDGIIETFNGLHGRTVTRKELVALQLRAAAHINFVTNHSAKAKEVFSRIDKVFDAYPDADSFELQIDDPIKPSGLGDPSDATHADQDLLCGLEHGCPPRSGLGKPVPASDIYDMITKRVLEAFSKPLDFTKEWGPEKDLPAGYVTAYNFDTKKPYRGINAFLLGSLHPYNPMFPLLKNPYYLTFEQIKKHGGKLRKGSRGHEVVYYTTLYRVGDFGTYDRRKLTAYLKDNGINPISVQEIPILKYYKVFSGADIDGIDFDLDNFKGKGKIPPQKAVWNNHEKIEAAEAVTRYYPKPAPKIVHGGNRAFYSPAKDVVTLPKLGQFHYAQAYYTTKYHELVHSTGSKKRLNREKGKKFADRAYCFEELVAELGASFLCAEAGILHYTFRNTAAYLKGWRDGLIKWAGQDNKFVAKAAAQAQKAVDLILDRDQDGVARYEKRAAMSRKFAEAGAKAAGKATKGEKQTAKKSGKSGSEPTKPNYKTRKRKTAPTGPGGQYVIQGLASPVAQTIPEVMQQAAPTQPPQQPAPAPVHAETTQEPPKPQPTANNQRANRLMSMQFDSLELSNGWEDFMQSPARNLRIVSFGKPKNGKTAGNLALALELTDHGTVLYDFADQGFIKSTQDLWLQSGLSEKPNAIPSDAMTLDDLEREIRENKPDFVFIDMINAFIDRENVKAHDFKDRFFNAYPDTGFILIMESTKGGDFKGDQSWTHIVDAIVEVRDFVMENRGRYGAGQYVVWEEGLQRFNPKRYQEIFGDGPDDGPVATIQI